MRWRQFGHRAFDRSRGGGVSYTRRLPPGARAPRAYPGGDEPAARDAAAALVVEGRNMDAPGSFRGTFTAIGYEGQEGAPSYASIIDLPSPGCWRLTLKTGDLEAQVNLRAVRLEP